MIDNSNALTIQELIDVLSKEEDKSKKVYLDVYPEWDNCTFRLPLSKDMFNNNYLIDFDTKEIGFVINGECQTDWFDEEEEEDD